jgi:hypothetical protein
MFILTYVHIRFYNGYVCMYAFVKITSRFLKISLHQGTYVLWFRQHFGEKVFAFISRHSEPMGSHLTILKPIFPGQFKNFQIYLGTKYQNGENLYQKTLNYIHQKATK